MSIEAILMIVAILVEGPIVWWIASKHRKEDNMQDLTKEMRTSIRNVHKRIDEIEGEYATEKYVNEKADHVKEVTTLQYNAIMENLNYIRTRLDEQSKDKSNK